MRSTSALVFALVVASSNAQQVPDGLSAADWTSIQAAHDAAQHRIFAVEGGHRARSPKQRWTVCFDGRGVSVQPDLGDWEWGLELASFGFAGDERAIGACAAVQSDGSRITYHWSDDLDEWFVNGAGGLEHGYTVHRRPVGDGTLVVSLRLRGELAPVLRAEARDVAFERGSATCVDYSGLHVFDADGRSLPARFSLEPHGLRLSIDERGARYPVTVDPIAQHAYLKASNADPNDRFGTAVAVSGGTVVVGAWQEGSNATGVNGNQTANFAINAGAAYVFVRNGATWSQQAYLKASNTDSGDLFGQSVAVSGDTIVVGAWGEDSNAVGVNGNGSSNSASSSGAAYVFVRSGTTWSQQAYLKASNTNAGDWFGRSVAVSGDTVVVGADGEQSSATGVNGNQADNSGWFAGAAYVFVRSGTTWTQQAYVKASNTGALDQFANTVALDGDTLVVGAPVEGSSSTGVNGNQIDNSVLGAGAAYVFTRNGTTWSQQAYLKASNTDAPDAFGTSIAVSGDTIVVGAPGEESSATGVDGNQIDDSLDQAGAAYVFVRSGTTWSQQAYLKASNTNTDDRFGCSVAIAADALVVGAWGESSNATGIDGGEADNTSPSAGAAYVFVRNGATWSRFAYLKASNADIYQNFGSSVAMSGTTIVVGAPSEGANLSGPFDVSAPAAGSSYVFDLRDGCRGSIRVPAQQAYAKASNTDPSDRFGWSVAVAGDTVVVGAPDEDSGATGVNGNQADNSAVDAGAAYVFVRNGASWSQQAYLKASNAGAGDRFGWAVAAHRDKVVVGAPFEASNATGVNGNQADNSAIDAGAAYVFVRVGTTWSQQAYLKAPNTEANDSFGGAVAVWDSLVVVGAVGEDSAATGVNGSQANNGAIDSGAAYAFYRQSSVWSLAAYLKATNTGANDRFGRSVAVTGLTIVVGAPFEDSSATGVNGNQGDNSAVDAGAAYVFVWNQPFWSQPTYVKASNTGAGDQFGAAIASWGDTLLVGAPGEDSNATGVNGNQGDNSATDSGAAYVFARAGSAWSQQAYLKASNTEAADHFGDAVAASSTTLAIGARGEDSSSAGTNGDRTDNNAADAGAVYVFTRADAAWAQWAWLKASNPAADDAFGASVSVWGDTVVVGAYGEDSVATGVGGNENDDTALGAGAAYVVSVAGPRPSLWPLNAARIGQSHTLAIDNLNPAFGLAILVFGTAQFPLPGIELGPILGAPCCELHNSVDVSIAAAVATGGSTSWTWNTVTGSPGDRIFCQALCLDPTANAFGFTLSNQVVITLLP